MRKARFLAISILIIAIFISGTMFGAQSTYKGFPTAKLMLNGKAVEPPKPAIIIDGTTYVPLRFISESMGMKVGWDQNTFTVSISDSSKPDASSTPVAATANTYTVKDGNGNALYTLTINKVSETSERNEFSEKTPAQVIIIDYTYTNIANTEDVYLFDSYFKVIDSKGEIGYTYPLMPVSFPQSIPKGTTCKAQMIFGLNNKSDSVKILFYKNIFDNNPTATFQIPITK